MRANPTAPATLSSTITVAVPDLSPAVMARIAGVLYLVIVVGGAFAQLAVRDGLVVAGDAAATARNIAGHELLYRAGFAIEVFYLLCGVPLKLLLYRIFSVVNRGLALVMVLFAALGAAVQGVILLAHYAPLVILGEGAHLAAFTQQQREAAALMSLQLFDYGYMIALSFFGCFCLIIGYLVTRSTFFPRFVGPLLAIEGVAYLANSFGHFISPPFGARVFPFLLVSGVAELSFCLTLLIAGVNVQRWRSQRALRSS
jgi:hypothetical protein